MRGIIGAGMPHLVFHTFWMNQMEVAAMQSQALPRKTKTKSFH